MAMAMIMIMTLPICMQLYRYRYVYRDTDNMRMHINRNMIPLQKIPRSPGLTRFQSTACHFKTFHILGLVFDGHARVRNASTEAARTHDRTILAPAEQQYSPSHNVIEFVCLRCLVRLQCFSKNCYNRTTR